MIKILKSKWLLAGVILLVAWLGLSFIKIKLRENIVNKEVGDLEDKVAGFEKSNNVLEKFIGYMTNPSFLEKEARLKLNYKASGEEVAFVYPDDNVKNPSSSVNFNKQLAQMPNLMKWWYWMWGY